MSEREVEVEVSDDEAAEPPEHKPVPITSLVMADIAMLVGSRVLQNVVERSFLKGGDERDPAEEIVRSKGKAKTKASGTAAKIATRSLSGAVIVGGGLLAKMLFDRGGRRKKARRAGKAALESRADNANSAGDT